MGIVSLDASHETLDEFATRFENAPADDLARQDAEENFDLIQPTGVSRRIDEVQALLLLHPRSGLLAPVRGAIVDDDVEVLTGIGFEQAPKKPDERLTGMAPDGLTPDVSAMDFQRREQRGGPITFVFVAEAFDLMGFHGQPRLSAVQGLDGGFFVDRQDHRILRRLQVQAHHGQHLRLELRVVRVLPVAKSVGLNRFGGQHRLHQRGTDPQVGRQRSHTPVRPHRRRGRGTGRGSDPVADDGIMLAFAAPAALIPQPVQPQLGKAPTPFDHHGFRHPQRLLDLVVAVPRGRQQDNPGSPRVPLGRSGGTNDTFQRCSFFRIQRDARGVPGHGTQYQLTYAISQLIFRTQH